MGGAGVFWRGVNLLLYPALPPLFFLLFLPLFLFLCRFFSFSLCFIYPHIPLTAASKPKHMARLKKGRHANDKMQLQV